MEKTVKFDITPKEMAEIFANMDDMQQGGFLAECEKLWTGPNMEMQMWALCDQTCEDGRNFIYRLANFLKASNVPANSPHFETLMQSYPEKD